MMTAMIDNQFSTDLDVSLKKLNIMSHDINESIPSSDGIYLFRPISQLRTPLILNYLL